MRCKIIKIAAISLSLLPLGRPENVHAQEKRTLTFAEYLSNIREHNIGYLSEAYSVDIADANLKAAKVFPDPELSVSYGNNQNQTLQMGYSVDAALSYTLELGGKRKARVLLAQSEKELTGALLESYFCNLRADAAIAYLTALKQQALLEIQKSSYRQMAALAHADSIRFCLGSITEVDARQSRLEAASMLNDVYASEGDLQDVLVQLLLFQGNKSMAAPDSVAGKLRYQKREFALPALIAAAQNNRADLQAALKSRDVLQSTAQLAKANRMADLGLSIGGGYSSEVLNEMAPAPAFKSFSAGINIPLKLSNLNRGALLAAQLAAAQSERQYEAAELQIAAEVAQAYNRYQTACRQVELFCAGMLDEAETIFKKKVYSYERGETSILELLNAQRTYNDVRVSYSETLYCCAAALVELERASGIWDVEI